jgi:hypothetical protein
MKFRHFDGFALEDGHRKSLLPSKMKDRYLLTKYNIVHTAWSESAEMGMKGMWGRCVGVGFGARLPHLPHSFYSM